MRVRLLYHYFCESASIILIYICEYTFVTMRLHYFVKSMLSSIQYNLHLCKISDFDKNSGSKSMN